MAQATSHRRYMLSVWSDHVKHKLTRLVWHKPQDTEGACYLCGVRSVRSVMSQDKHKGINDDVYVMK